MQKAAVDDEGQPHRRPSRHGIVFEMSVNDESAASRQFVASSMAFTPKWATLTGKRATTYVQAVFWVFGGLTFGPPP